MRTLVEECSRRRLQRETRCASSRRSFTVCGKARRDATAVAMGSPTPPPWMTHAAELGTSDASAVRRLGGRSGGRYRVHAQHTYKGARRISTMLLALSVARGASTRSGHLVLSRIVRDELRRFPRNRDDLLSPKESGFSGRGSIALPLSYSPDGLVGVEPTTHGLTTESVSVCLPDECAFWNATSEREAKSQSGNATRGGAPWVNVHPAGFEPAVEGAGVEPERMALLD